MNAARRHNLTFNNDKTVISVESISLLGYIISHRVLKPDPDRVKSLLDLNPPLNRKSLQRIMGMFSYYAHWVPHFSDKIKPLTVSTTFPLSKPAIDAFELLKQDIASATLNSFDESKTFIVETDASDVAISASLNQEGKPVAFFSRTLNKSESKYSSVDKEAFAIIEAVRKWRHLLLGKRFTLVTDQKAVSFMFDSQRFGKIKNDKIQRWRIDLSPYS